MPDLVSAGSAEISTVQPSIDIELTHETLQEGPIQGFKYFWASYVHGYKPGLRCQACFKRAKGFSTGEVQSGRTYPLKPTKPGKYLYICGVGLGPEKELGDKNFHLPVQYACGETITASTYNGYTLRIQNAKALPIPSLPLGWEGWDEKTTRCKNVQFAVAYFGSQPRLKDLGLAPSLGS